MTQKYTALPAFPFIFQAHSSRYAVVGADSEGASTLVVLRNTYSEDSSPVYTGNVSLSAILSNLNSGIYTLVSNAPQEEVVPETPVAKATMFDPLVIRIDTTEVERALSILTELEASVTRVKALFA